MSRAGQKLGRLEKTCQSAYEGSGHEDVQRILNHLHNNDLVFGDVRSANIMVTRNNKVKFVDFDWAGKAEVSRPFYCHSRYSGLTA